MARIRTIKPEFPQSESMGRVSRESRYCFVLLWTLADDSGRLRGNSRMLASLLFPYDDDAHKLIDVWLNELDREGCLVRYRSGDDTYIQICNWLKHQKIDKPSASKIPPFTEDSRILSNPREGSCGDQGSRKGSRIVPKDQGIDLAAADDGEGEIISGFDEIKMIYPTRVGGHRWKDAQSSYNQRLKEGHTHIEIIEGIKRYTKFLEATGKMNTAYIQQAATFIGTNKGFMQLWTLPTSKAQQQQDRMINTALEWLQESK